MQGPFETPLLRTARTWLRLARGSFTLIFFVGGALWYLIPLCLHFDKSQAKQVKVLSFVNAYGSSYLLWWTLVFALVYNASQLSAQIVLGLGVMVLVFFLEVVDGVRDVQYWQ
ncbi:hypothetical protein BDZ89DRAFT_1150393 [Hymenopellis radicata]|nr:hypothetical protein BDZ89DRAFT_1150393 [Hymenopellis radicata]